MISRLHASTPVIRGWLAFRDKGKLVKNGNHNIVATITQEYIFYLTMVLDCFLELSHNKKAVNTEE
jgi:hypothetical protein